MTTADSQFIQKDRNDLSRPGAQQRAKSISARRENNSIIERTEVVDSNVIFVGVEFEEIEKKEKESRSPGFNVVSVRVATVTISAATWP